LLKINEVEYYFEIAFLGVLFLIYYWSDDLLKQLVTPINTDIDF